MLEPIVRGTGLHLDILSERFDISDYVSEPVHKLLRAFSDIASKDGAALHPLDRDRWIEFIIAAHRERADWVASQMEKWLVSEGWSHDAAERLAAEYEFACALLEANEPRGPV